MRLSCGVWLVCWSLAVSAAAADEYAVTLTVVSDLPLPNVPMDPTIDFARLIREANLPGVLDPNSIRVVDRATGQAVPHALENFQYGDRGQVEWVIEDPAHKKYEIRFATADKRPALAPRPHVPMIGVGDLMRYNAGEPRPIALPYVGRLVDLTGDGKPDLVGCWSYAYRAGEPYSGIFCYPRVGSTERFEFGEATRVRYVDRIDASEPEFKHFSDPYMHADFADLNKDGLVDVVFSPRRWGARGTVSFYLNTGRRDAGGMPIWAAGGGFEHPARWWGPVRAVDVNQDGALDFVVGGMYDIDERGADGASMNYYRNDNPNGWPAKLADPAPLDVGHRACFYDIDRDGKHDAVCLVRDPRSTSAFAWVFAWRKNLGADPPRFAAAKILHQIDAPQCLLVAAVTDGPSRGLLVAHNYYRRVSFFEHIDASGSEPKFRRRDAASLSAVMALGDQNWPCCCDWDADGDWDLVCGNGHGWPWIAINQGTNKRPAFAEAGRILADGKPIRILMNDEFDVPDYWHNMGYPYPICVDWDGDGLADLMVPNITNRIYWYQNVGTRSKPAFGPRRQLIVDGYPDTPEARAKTAQLLMSKGEGHPEPAQPFFWRTGAAFADWNDDGLMDFITLHGESRKATFYMQYRDSQGELRLKEHGPVMLADGRAVEKSLVGRPDGWAESFRAVDWDADGRIDLVYSCSSSDRHTQDGGSMYLVRNCGTKTDPKFESPRTLRCFGEPIHITHHGPHPWVGDLDGDGKPDILACVELSVYPFYRHAALEMNERPKYELGVASQR